MAGEIYLKLREQLDQYSFGYPATESGVELKILERLFTEEEAELFLYLSLIAETPQAVAERTGRDPTATAALLDRMADKGLVFRLRRGDTPKYAAVPFVAGILEFQVGTLDRELSELLEQYGQEAFHQATARDGATMLRPIPVNRSVEAVHAVAPYEDAREIVKQQKVIGLADCICRVIQGQLNQACDKPLDVCFVFGSHAEYYIERGMARRVSVEEAIKALDRAEEAGLVTQPVNCQKPSGMCNCCGDCCGVLKALNKLDKPAQAVVSNYYAALDPELCTGCEICLDRCQMAAISMNDEAIAQINLDRCIGCGLCVTTCPGEALQLELKPEEQRKSVPKTAAESLMQMVQKRGKSLAPLALGESR